MALKLPYRLSGLAIYIAFAAASASGVLVCALVAPLSAQTVSTPSTDGVASASDRIDSPVALPLSSVLPDRPMAITGELPIWQTAPGATAQAPENVAPRRKIKNARK